jgi:hypothetical protein
MAESRSATGLHKLSEISDVLYALSRSKYDGYAIRQRLKLSTKHIVPYTYMFFKYSLRWGFYRVAGIVSRSPNGIREVVNPCRDSKLQVVGERWKVGDVEQFIKTAKTIRRFWPLLP